MEFNAIYYFDEEKINTLYYQLPNNAGTISIETDNSINVSFSTTLKSNLLKLFGCETEIGSESTVNKSKRKTATHETNMFDKLIGLLEKINEKEFKDIYYLIEKYLQDEKNILAVGKGDFVPLLLSRDKKRYGIDDINFPSGLDLILFSGQYAENLPHSKTRSPYSKRIFVIMQPSNIIEEFGLYYTANRTYYFLGRIIKSGNDYLISPFALWGDCVIL